MHYSIQNGIQISFNVFVPIQNNNGNNNEVCVFMLTKDHINYRQTLALE